MIFILILSSMLLNFSAMALDSSSNETQKQVEELDLERCEMLEEVNLPHTPTMIAITDCLAPPLDSNEKVVAK